MRLRAVLIGLIIAALLHYVTFWDGLCQMTTAAALPNPKFGQADWKFNGA